MSTAIERGGDDLVDRYLAEAPAAPAVEPAGQGDAEVVHLDDYRPAQSSAPAAEPEAEVHEEPEPAVEEPEQGRTKTVRERERELAEARRLVALQQQDVTAEVDTRKVRKARKHGVQARKLHALRQRPEAVALRDARVRLWTTVMALFATVAALGWSTASVQQTAAHGAPAGSVAYGLAFLVEPLISLGLLATIGVQAYAAMRGHVVDKSTEPGATLHRTQIWLLVLTITLNTWPYIEPIWGPGEFDPIQVVVHLVGPIVAVRLIHSLPAMWAVLEGLELPTQPAASEGVTPPEYRENAAPTAPSSKANPDPSRVAQIRDELAHLIATGQWTKNVSAGSIREHFGCGTPIAQQVRDQLKQPTQ